MTRRRPFKNLDRIAERAVASTHYVGPTKLAPIMRGDGTITGWIKLHWSRSMQRYVSIPDAE